MVDVTVLGAGGATVTIALSSAETAAAAQSALGKVSDLTKLGLVDVQTHSSFGDLPALQNSLGALILNGSGFSGLTGDAYRLIAATGTGRNTAVSGRNAITTVIAGDKSDLKFANNSLNSDVYLGSNSAELINLVGKMTATTSDGTHLVATQVGSTTTVNMGVGGTINVIDYRLGGGLGSTMVNAAGSGTINAFAGDVEGGLVNVGLSKGDVGVGLVGTQAVINPGAANVTIIGNTAASATLFGGTGSVTVGGLAGNYTGGSAGNNQMFSSTVSGSTTLMGGAGTATTPGDVLGARGANQVLIAGTGNATLAAITAFGATGGSTFNIGAGISTVFGFEAGGNTVNLGGTNSSTISILLGRNNGTVPAVGNTYNDLNTYGGAGPRPQFSIGDFETGLDTLTVKSAFEIKFFAITDPANFTGTEVTTLRVEGGGFYTFFDATPDGVQNIFASDVKTV